jgi:hypothetical protein
MSAIKRHLEAIQEGLEAQADQDFADHVGKVILARVVTGYNDKDDSVEVFCNPPARMRVCKTRREDIHHWNDEFLDPYWDVEEVGAHPALVGIRSMWVFGRSYSTGGEVEPCSEWTLEKTSLGQKVRDLVRSWRTK